MKAEVYPKALLEDYETLTGAYPQHFKLREKVADILRDHFKNSKKVIIADIGCGTGETTGYILKQTSIAKVVAIDNDEGMIERLKDNLKEYVVNGRLIPVCRDIFDYIKKVDTSFFDGITSSWTIHNFTKNKRNDLLKEIFRTLKPKGIFVNMDKYVFDDPKKERQSFDEAVKKLKLISNKAISDTAIKHEEDDRHPNIIMKELESASEMKGIGFRNLRFYLRIGRETVMSCLK